MKQPFNCENTGCSYPNCVCGKNLSNTVILSGVPQPQQSKSAESILDENINWEYVNVPKAVRNDFAKCLQTSERTVALKSMHDFATLQTTAKEKEFCEALEEITGLLKEAKEFIENIDSDGESKEDWIVLNRINTYLNQSGGSYFGETLMKFAEWRDYNFYTYGKEERYITQVYSVFHNGDKSSVFLKKDLPSLFLNPDSADALRQPLRSESTN